MKFNEKLIELRKKQGLSQEELGYKLNVTRQTVSKWELGETTPEMAKLIELSKIFNISVDELTNESEISSNVNPIIEDQPIQNKTPKNNKLVIIIVIILIAVIVGIVGKAVITISTLKSAEQGVMDEAKGIIGKIYQLINKEIDSQLEENENASNRLNTNLFNGTLEFYNGSNSGIQLKELLEEIITTNKKEERKITVKYLETETQDTEEIKNLKTSFKDLNKFEISFDYDEDGYINKVTIEQSVSEIGVKIFNSSFELYKGDNSGSQLKRLLEEIITKNKTGDKKVAVKYMETETQDAEEIKNLKTSIKDSNNFEATFDYDEEGYINKVTIEKVVSEFEKSSFNGELELYGGSKNGMIVTNVLDKIITSNKTEDRKITVKYNGKETQDENEIKNIKKNFGTFDNCEITYEYDADGFINKVTIEKL